MAFATSGCLGVDFTATPTSAEFDLGTVVIGTDNTEWVYVQAGGAITQYHCVAIDENYQAVHLTTALNGVGHKIGFAQVAFVDNDYGWIATRGSNIKLMVASSCAADTMLFTTTGAGILDDASASAASRVYGVVTVAANPSAAAAVEVIATFPRAGGDEAVS